MSMPRSSSLSKWRSRLHTPLLLAVLLLLSCSNASQDKELRAFSSYAVTPLDEDDKLDVKWADYLASHLEKRGAVAGLVGSQPGEDALLLRVDLDPSLKEGFSWQWSRGGVLTLRARDQERMLWLQYQAISSIGKADIRFEVGDIPPPSVAIADDGEGDFPFEYRSIYSPSNRNEDLMPILGCGNIDYDWALWGHNLGKALGENLPDDAFALVDGARDHDQFCFSSPEIYGRLEHFVIDQYGEGAADDGQRFAIMPNDNAVVCGCERCKKLGNTAVSASPAVSALIERLARRFPHHLFFTSSYASVKEPPSKTMPANVGVLISAMDLPMANPLPDRAREDFSRLVKRWRQTVDRVYVWDYMRNFDDYLTPYPLLSAVRGRLQLYRELGVRGVVFNGSGEDYATFDDMQTFAVAALMLRPDCEVEPLVEAYFDKYFPKSGPQLADYYLQLERSARTLPFYGGIADMAAAGLDPAGFMKFFNALDKASKTIKGDERKRLNKLLTGLNFTVLELQRSPLVRPDKELVATSLENLGGHSYFPDMAQYREAKGSLKDYLAYYAAHPSFVGRPVGLSCANVPQLTDGYVGSPYDYHTNWRVSPSPVDTVRLTCEKPSGSLRVSFLHASRWHIYQPSSVTLWQDGRQLAEARSPQPALNRKSEGFHRVTYTLPLTRVRADRPFELRVSRMEGRGKTTTACDEIEIR